MGDLRFYRRIKFVYANRMRYLQECSSHKRTKMRKRGQRVFGKEKKIMPLVFAPVGQEMKVVKIVSDDKTKKHLANLGILSGATITVVSSTGGNVVCIVKDGRLALDRNVSMHIFVA